MQTNEMQVNMIMTQWTWGFLRNANYHSSQQSLLRDQKGTMSDDKKCTDDEALGDDWSPEETHDDETDSINRLEVEGSEQRLPISPECRRWKTIRAYVTRFADFLIII